MGASRNVVVIVWKSKLRSFDSCGHWWPAHVGGGTRGAWNFNVWLEVTLVDCTLAATFFGSWYANVLFVPSYRL
jgi:hypothetical protein